MRCPTCQHNNPDEARFCNQCGASLGITCQQCRTQNPHGSRFCQSCGSALTETTKKQGKTATRKSELRSQLGDKECPSCGLFNPGSAERCDCGYDFPSGQMKESYLEQEEQGSTYGKRGLTGFFDNLLWGPVNPALICPHCQTKGQVRTTPAKRKRGISGGKATGVLLTAGISLLATGLSRKERVMQAHCDNCNSTWDF